MIIVTGANGFIGSAIVRRLNEQGTHDILCTDLVPPGERPELLKKAKYSQFMTETELLDYLDSNSGSEVEWVIHMGACSDTTETDADYLDRVNLNYTKSIFNWCTKEQVPLIYASSGAVYGNGGQGFEDDIDPEKLEALNLYGKSKIDFDRWVVKQEKTPPQWYGLRFFNVYGPNEYHKGAMASVVFKAYNQINETGRLKLFRSHNPNYEDGRQLRDFVYVKDITTWITALMDHKGPSGIYNMGYGEARAWLDLAQSVFKNMNKELDIDWIDIPESIRNQYQYYTKANTNRLKSLKIGEAQWSLEKGVTDYLQNYLLTEDPYL